jgi:REP element-mobilizing transposase RayT
MQQLLIGYVVIAQSRASAHRRMRQGHSTEVLKVLKQRVSRDLGKNRGRRPTGQSHCAFTTDDENLPCVWQPRFYDFNVWSEKKVREKLEYTQANPITRKLVENPKDWPWSSSSFCAKGEAGLVTVDPVGG